MVRHATLIRDNRRTRPKKTTIQLGRGLAQCYRPSLKDRELHREK
jgi:hypothetical protein